MEMASGANSRARRWSAGSPSSMGPWMASTPALAFCGMSRMRQVASVPRERLWLIAEPALPARALVPFDVPRLAAQSGRASGVESALLGTLSFRFSVNCGASPEADFLTSSRTLGNAVSPCSTMLAPDVYLE